MESIHYTRSKAHRTSLVANTQSDVDPDGVALQSGHSGPVRLSVTAAEKLESLPPSAPVQGADGGVGSTSFLQAGASLGAREDRSVTRPFWKLLQISMRQSTS